MICASTVPRPCCFVPTTVCDSTIVAGKSDLRESNIVDFTKSKIGKNIYKTTNIWADTHMSLLPPFALNTFAITLSARLPLVLLYCNVATEGVRRRGGLSGLTSWSSWSSRSQLNVHSITWNTVKEKIVVAIFCGDFCIKKSYFGEKRRASGTMWALTTSSSIVPTFCNGLKTWKLFFFKNKLNPTRNVSKAESIGTKKVNFPAQENYSFLKV